MANRSEIAVYHLLDPSVLVEQEAAIKSILCVGQNSDEFHLTLNPVSGWMHLAPQQGLYTNNSQGSLPPTSEAALQQVHQYFSRINDLMQQSSGGKALGIPPLFSMKLQHVYTNYVPQRQAGQADHWLSRFHISLDTAYKELSTQVLGAGIDVRIGSGGKVVSLSYHWRPVVKKRRVEIVNSWMFDLLDADNTREASSSGDGHAHNHTEPPALPESLTAGTSSEALTTEEALDALLENEFRILYALGGQNAPMTILAPFLSLVSGHHFTFTPLCEYALLAQIGYAFEGDTLSLTALTLGGSGLYEYEWAYWQIHALEKGVHTEGNQFQLNIPAGLYNVALNVRDRKTGTTTQTQTMTYGGDDTLNLA